MGRNFTGSSRISPYFGNNSSTFGERVGLKMEFDPIKHLVADRFFNKMGFVTPNYGIIPKDTAEGTLIFEKLSQLGTAYFEGEEPSDLSQLQHGTFQTHLKHRNFFLAMDYLNANPFRSVAAEDMLGDFSDHDFLKNLGEVMSLREKKK